MQGGAVGAAACRMRVPPKARSRRRVPQPVGSSASKSLRPCRAEHAAFASQTGLRLKSPTGAFMPCGHRRPFWFSFVRQKRTSSSGEAFPRKSETFPLCAENISFSPPFYTKGCFLSNRHGIIDEKYYFLYTKLVSIGMIFLLCHWLSLQCSAGVPGRCSLHVAKMPFCAAFFHQFAIMKKENGIL